MMSNPYGRMQMLSCWAAALAFLACSELIQLPIHHEDEEMEIEVKSNSEGDIGRFEGYVSLSKAIKIGNCGKMSSYSTF